MSENYLQNLPSRYVTKKHGCEARKTMLYNLQTDLYPNGLNEEDLQKPFVGVVTAWNEAAPCNIALSRQAQPAKKGGNLGFVFEDNLPASLVENLKQLKKHQITKPIAVGDSWFIVQLQQTRKAEILPFEKAKEQLAENLAKLAIEDFIEKSLEQAKINIK